MLIFRIAGQKIELERREIVADEQIAFVTLLFLFTSEWEQMDKVAQFHQNENIYNVHLGKGNVAQCTLPSEITNGQTSVSVFGYHDTVRATTASLEFRVCQAGFSDAGSTPIPPTPDLYAQLLQELEKKAAGIKSGKDGKDGKDGISPLVSIAETESGATITITDATGTTTAELHNGKRGDPGEQGEPGQQGLQGIPGEKGDPGVDGKDGKDGISPIVSIAETESGATITITDATGTTTTELHNGKKGDPGEQGEPGQQGLQGIPGEKGDPGVDGKDGKDGISPTATVSETDTGAMITITDKNGTTTATIKNGTSGEVASWDDFTPGWDGQSTLSYCTAKLVTVMGKQTWQILPTISSVSHNALDIVPDGLFVPDLSPDVDAIHTKIEGLENSIGDIATILATMVEV